MSSSFLPPFALHRADEVVAHDLAHRLAAADRKAQGLEFRFEKVGHGRQALGVAGPGFDIDQFFQGLDHRRLLSRGGREQGFIARLRPCTGGQGQRRDGRQDSKGGFHECLLVVIEKWGIARYQQG
jgi:hypothetical protein